MGLILAGIFASVLIIGITFLYLSSRFASEFGILLVLLAIGCIVIGFFGGIIEPVSGYEEPQIVSTTKLVGLRDSTVAEGTGRMFYVSVLGTNSYTYYVEVDSPYASSTQKSYKSNTISDSNVTIVEDDSYTEAKLITYVRYGKKSFWTFAVGAKQYEYVFYVPTGTIARDASLS